MPGLYDNETRKYVEVEELEKGEWFDRDGFIYIIPQNGVVCDSVGPDDEIEDQLNALMQKTGEITEEDCNRLGVVRIDECLKRFTFEEGYYHA